MWNACLVQSRCLPTGRTWEIAPFVANWNATLDGLGADGRLPAFWGKKFRRNY